MAASEIAKCVFSIDSKKAVSALNIFNGQLNQTSAIADSCKAAVGALFSGSVLAGSKYFIDLASDAQETTQKFGVVFASVSTQADTAVKKLVNTYNMSTHAAKTALSDTGDLLSGFGFTGAAALDMAEKVNQLGSDLASFTNYSGGAKGAAEALTKALLGEREQAKMLGIAILEEQVQAQILEDKKNGITYSSQQQAKAYATLRIAQRQSVNAIGDAERSTQSYAYNSKKLANNLDDLKRSIGAALIEPATKITTGLAKAVNWVNQLNPAIVKYGTIATVSAGFVTGLSIAIFKVYNAVSTYCVLSKLGAAATQYNTTQTVANTASTTANSGALNTGSVSRNLSIQSITAQTAALAQNTIAARANSIANSGITVPGGSVKSSVVKGLSAGKPGQAVPALRSGSSSVFPKISTASDFLSLKTWIPGYQKLGKSVGGIFGKIPALIMKPLSLITGLFGKSKLLGTVISFAARIAGFATPFIGWGAAIVTGVSLVFKAFKKMPEWLEISIQEFWPKIKSGGLYVIGKVANFLSPSNLWEMIGNVFKGFKNLLVAGWEGLGEVGKRLAGFETDAQKAYTSNKIVKSLEESRQWTNALADAEKQLTEQRKINLAATKNSMKGMAEEQYGKFDTTSGSKQKARQKAIDEEQKNLENLGVNSKAKEEVLSKRNMFFDSYKRDEAEMARLKNQVNSSAVGAGDLDKFEEKRKVLQKSIDFNKGQVEGYDTQLKSFEIDPKKVTEQYRKVINLKADDAIETAKETREASATKSNNSFERSMLGKTGSEKTAVLQNRLSELQSKEQADLDIFNKQETARARLKEIAANADDPVNADLAQSAMNGNYEAQKKLGESYDKIFKDLAPMLSESDLLQNAKDVQTAKNELKTQQADDRALTYKNRENEDTKRINTSGGKLQDAENEYGNDKEKALKMDKSTFEKATNDYVLAMNRAFDDEKNALNNKIANIDAEIALTTDQEKIAELQSEKIGLENDLANKQRENNKKIEDTYKERDRIERERSDRQKGLKQNIQKSLDEALLKEAKTGKQRLAIYGGQFQRAMQEYRTAKNSEKKFEALGKVKEASDSINGEIEAMAKKQEERNKNVWTTAAPQKAVTAGSTEAYSIQNKLYNSFQRNVERNTKDMVGLNKRMIAELQTLNSQQQSEYTLDVKV
jgi:hypothetical protein